MIFIHQLADVGTDNIGEGSRVWQFAVVLKGAVLGKDCNICAHTFIEQNVVLGDRVTVKSGVFLWAGTRIGNDVFLGPNATFTNDKFPRSKQYPEQFSGILIEDGASIGANATLLPGIRIGSHAMVGAGAVVTRDVPERAIVGNPARVMRFLPLPVVDDSNPRTE
jgi:UDP-2-acetamido-3-amino-2,3-dideoxy-glucuronate N-acetyltransferase